ncbi:MAG: GNAT family N-acetyltransferase [Clostridia bacterium]|nr:GNAT family N-acetyltransferase [Clostridia bacterium]
MTITLAKINDKQQIETIDSHIPSERLEECIRNRQVYILKEDAVEGILRYSLFWQMIPFLDLIYIQESYRGKGFGTEMMAQWEKAMNEQGYSYVMTSTQADEDAWRFYEKLGYEKAGGFFPPEQEAEEWIYLKRLR